MILDDDFDKWQAQWDKALEDGVFVDEPRPKPEERPVPADFSPEEVGARPQLKDPYDVERNVDTVYWDYVHKFADGPCDAPDVLMEMEKAEKADKILKERDEKSFMKDKADAIGGTSNPIQPYSVGVDQDLKVTQNWTDGEGLAALNNLKLSLERLEIKLNSDEALGKDNKTAQKQIDKIKQQIEALGRSLAGSPMGDEQN